MNDVAPVGIGRRGSENDDHGTDLPENRQTRQNVCGVERREEGRRIAELFGNPLGERQPFVCEVSSLQAAGALIGETISSLPA